MRNTVLKMAAMSVFAIAGLMGCGDKGETANETAKPTTEPNTPAVVSGGYKVGVDVTYPPYAFLDERGQVVGFEPEILQAIADDQKMSLEFVHAPRSTLYPDLIANRYQIVAASLNINPERQAQSELSEPYAKSQRVILSKKDQAVNSYADLGTATVSVQESTNSHRILTELNISTRLYPSLFESFSGFMTGGADYVVGDKIPLEYFLNNNSKNVDDYKFTPFNPSEDSSPVVFASNKGDLELLGKINAGLASIKSSGKYNEIYNKWFKNADASILVK